MTLTPEQQKAVETWIAAGEGLAGVQKRLADEFKVSLTYRDVRFLVDDLNLRLKDAAPKLDASNLKQTQPAPAPAPEREKKGFFDKAKEKLGLGGEEPEAEEPEELEPLEDEIPGGPSTVSVSVDKVSLIPNAVASGTVKFSDGVTGKWIVDHYGRPGFTEISKPGYRPSPADAQAFMKELASAIQGRGF